jgi:hypothetical protein
LPTRWKRGRSTAAVSTRFCGQGVPGATRLGDAEVNVAKVEPQPVSRLRVGLFDHRDNGSTLSLRITLQETLNIVAPSQPTGFAFGTDRPTIQHAVPWHLILLPIMLIEAQELG